MTFDLQVRAAVYTWFVEHARAPRLDDVAHEVGGGPGDVAEAYQRLHARRMLVLMPDGISIRMAPPFSGIETQHEVHARGQRYYANCAWDSFGIPAALHEDAEVLSRCEQTREPLRIHLTSDGPPPSDWVFHVALPAAHWWRNIVDT